MPIRRVDVIDEETGAARLEIWTSETEDCAVIKFESREEAVTALDRIWRLRHSQH